MALTGLNIEAEQPSASLAMIALTEEHAIGSWNQWKLNFNLLTLAFWSSAKEGRIELIV